MSKRRSEKVLCFPSDVLDRLGRFQGISLEVKRYFPAVVTAPCCRYVVREEAEADPGFKQVIPYVLLLHRDRIFSYRRGKRGGESRLHELLSVGIGGHIEVADRGLFSQEASGYYQAMWREVTEEVSLEAGERPPCVAVINDDSTDVGRVHFGIVHVVPLASPSVSKSESAITGSGFVPVRDALARVDQYETWSQFCLRSMDRLTESLP